tara:strand:+ start:881 stop:1123 length:243 start_codon:yes stop_codon:yes gene_type:complete
MRNAWHKALKNVEEYAPMIYLSVVCSQLKACLALQCEPAEYGEGDLDLRKLDFVKRAKADGWTYDKNGNWLCPDCSKEGE